MLVSIAQINPTIGALQANVQSIASAIKQARKQYAECIIFPECALCGYPPQDLLLHQSFGKECEDALLELLPLTKGLTVILGMPRPNPEHAGKAFFNSAAILQNGKVLGYQDKSLLPSYNVFDENRYFTSGEGVIKVWSVGTLKFGVLICEDTWFEIDPYYPEQYYPKSPADNLQPGDVDFLVNISASPFTSTKRRKRHQNLMRIIERLKCPVVTVNQVGAQDGLIFDGNSFVTNAQGVIVERAKSYKEDLVTFSLEKLPKKEKNFPLSEESEMYNALVLGIRDYFGKQGLKYAFIGISGGIDSALTAALAVDALGRENVTGVLMPSPYTSKESEEDAIELCQRLNIALHKISIASLYGDYLEVLSPYFKKYAMDVTEENIQARIRGNLLMALANKHKGIVLATGNKSEMAMGYCTLYGDMCGGLAVLSDVWKTEVYKLSRWINREVERIPRSILTKEPTAELKPNQKDQDTLPEYSLLDKVLKAYVENKDSFEEIALHTGESSQFIQKIIHRVHRQEFKRRQAPLGLIVSDLAFTCGYRYPIVQGWQV